MASDALDTAAADCMASDALDTAAADCMASDALDTAATGDANPALPDSLA
jgi:hypothetical protein